MGDDFFRILTEQISRTLGVGVVAVAELRAGAEGGLAWLATAGARTAGGMPLELVSGEELNAGQTFGKPRNAWREFAADHPITLQKLETRMGISLLGRRGDVIGALVLADRRPCPSPRLARDVLRAVGPRAAAEIERRRTERALRFGRFMLDHLSEATFLVSSDARILYANDAACRGLGLDRAELLQRRVHDIDPSVTPDSWPSLWQRSAELKEYSIETRHQRKDGTEFDVALSATHLEYEERSFQVAVCSNVTEQRRSERWMTGERQILEGIASGVPLDHTLTALTRLLQEVSPDSLCSVLLRDDRSNLLRHGAAPSLPESYTREVDGIPIGEGEGSCGTAASRRKLVVVEDLERDPLWDKYRHLARKHGLRACWSTPIFSSSGSVLGTFATYYMTPRSPDSQDLSRMTAAGHIAGIAIERRQAEDDLETAARRFRMLIECMPDGVIVHRFGPIVYANRRVAEVLGCEHPDELVGRSVLDIVMLEDRAASEERLELMRSLRDPLPSRELTIPLPSGSSISVETLAMPIQYDREAAVLVMARDLTHRKAMQAHLLQADRMASIGTLAAGIAHEINNPLSYVISNLDFLAKSDAILEEGGETVETLMDAREGAERVRRIVEDLRMLSGPTEELGPVDVCDVLNSAINLAWSDVRDRATLEREFEAVPCVRANAPRLGQVFLNLLLNAAQALPDRPMDANQIRASVHRIDPARVMVTIQDNGVGIAPENLERIFRPFFTTKAVGIGTGLGLSICENILTRLGGSIAVESEVDSHTAFRVLLPVYDPQVARG